MLAKIKKIDAETLDNIKTVAVSTVAIVGTVAVLATASHLIKTAYKANHES